MIPGRKCENYLENSWVWMLALSGMQVKIHSTIWVKYFILHMSIIETHTHTHKCAHTESEASWGQQMCINSCVFASVHRMKYMSPQTHPRMPMSVSRLSFIKYPSCVCKISLYFQHQILSMVVIKWLFAPFYAFLQDSLCVNDCCIQESCHVYS